MLDKRPESARQTRLIRCSQGGYRLVSLERTYWDSLDWLVVSCNEDIYDILADAWYIAVNVAEEDDSFTYNDGLMWVIFNYLLVQESIMHGLANDNILTPYCACDRTPRSKSYPQTLKFPAVFRLLHFMPHATTFEAVQEREF